MRVTGVIDAINTRDTSAGKMYDIVVNGKSYGAGKYAPSASVGDAVEFEAEQNGRFLNVGRKTLRKIPKSEVESQPTATATREYSARPAAKASDGWDERQATISKQAAINTAIEFVKVANDVGALKLPAKESDKLMVLEMIVLTQAARFHEVSTGKKMELPEFLDSPAKASKSKTAKKQVEEDEYEDEFADDDIPF